MLVWKCRCHQIICMREAMVSYHAGSQLIFILQVLFMTMSTILSWNPLIIFVFCCPCSISLDQAQMQVVLKWRKRFREVPTLNAGPQYGTLRINSLSPSLASRSITILESSNYVLNWEDKKQCSNQNGPKPLVWCKDVRGRFTLGAGPRYLIWDHWRTCGLEAQVQEFVKDTCMHSLEGRTSNQS